MDIHFTNCKLPSIHSALVSRSKSKATTYSYAEKTHYDFKFYLQNLATLTPSYLTDRSLELEPRLLPF